MAKAAEVRRGGGLVDMVNASVRLAIFVPDLLPVAARSMISWRAVWPGDYQVDLCWRARR